MNSSQEYSLQPSEHFERSYAKLKKAYANSGGTDPEGFLTAVGDALKVLRKAPTAREAGCDLYAWPAKVNRGGWELWRITFILPGVRGAARHARIMYVINRATNVVVPFWVYNHDQFAKRPADDDIRRQLKAIFST